MRITLRLNGFVCKTFYGWLAVTVLYSAKAHYGIMFNAFKQPWLLYLRWQIADCVRKMARHFPMCRETIMFIVAENWFCFSSLLDFFEPSIFLCNTQHFSSLTERNTGPSKIKTSPIKECGKTVKRCFHCSVTKQWDLHQQSYENTKEEISVYFVLRATSPYLLAPWESFMLVC